MINSNVEILPSRHARERIAASNLSNGKEKRHTHTETAWASRDESEAAVRPTKRTTEETKITNGQFYLSCLQGPFLLRLGVDDRTLTALEFLL